MGENKKIINCKVCDKEIAKNAKTCPNCGAKNKKPIYKKWWFWVLLVLFIALVSPSNESENKGTGYNDTTNSTISAEEKKFNKVEKYYTDNNLEKAYVEC